MSTLSPKNLDPFSVLGLSESASEVDVRNRYLQLVKRNPPEKDPDRFKEIHEAYRQARDPLVIARRLTTSAETLPDWQAVINQQKLRPPKLTATQILALGNHADCKPCQAASVDSSDAQQRSDGAHE